jgi:hypothetical protein
MDFPMTGHSVVTDALKAATREANAFKSNPPLPCTLEHIRTAIRNAQGRVREQIILTWLTAGRVGDVLQLKRECVNLKAAALSVMFRRGKCASDKPYTVHTACPPDWRQFIEPLLTRAKPGQFLWHADSPKARSLMGRDVAAALKTAEPRLEQRSIRRGALQKMAADPSVTEDTLMAFSGHRRAETLRGYLDWGSKCSSREKTGKEAAALLAGGPLSA